MVKRIEVAPTRLHWTVPQVHAAIAEPHFLQDFHACIGAAYGVHIEPWQPPTFNSEAGFAKQRRMLYTTALLHGLPWPPSAGSGSGGTAEVVELQEMMYDRESGCLVSEQTLFAVAAGSGRQARAWHTQLIYAPAEGGASTVKAVVTAAASGITTTEAEQQRMEERLAALGAEKVRELAAFTLQYIARYAAAGKLLPPDQAAKGMLGDTVRLPALGPTTPDKLPELPFAVGSTMLILPHMSASTGMDWPAAASSSRISGAPAMQGAPAAALGSGQQAAEAAQQPAPGLEDSAMPYLRKGSPAGRMAPAGASVSLKPAWLGAGAPAQVIVSAGLLQPSSSVMTSTFGQPPLQLGQPPQPAVSEVPSPAATLNDAISAEERQLLERLAAMPAAPRRMPGRTSWLPRQQQRHLAQIPPGQQQQHLPEHAAAATTQAAWQQPVQAPGSSSSKPQLPGQIASVSVAEWIATQHLATELVPEPPAFPWAGQEEARENEGDNVKSTALSSMGRIHVSVSPRGTHRLTPLALPGSGPAQGSCSQLPSLPRTLSMADTLPLEHMAMRVPFMAEREQGKPDQALAPARSESDLSLTPRSSPATDGYSLARSPFPSAHRRATAAAAQLLGSCPPAPASPSSPRAGHVSDSEDEQRAAEVASYEGDTSSHGPSPLGAPYEELLTSQVPGEPDQDEQELASMETVYQDATESVQQSLPPPVSKIGGAAAEATFEPTAFLSASAPGQGDNGTNTASAMQAVMAVAIETVNTVVETAMTTVNKMTLVTLEQLQSANAQHQWQACGPPFAPILQAMQSLPPPLSHSQAPSQEPSAQGKDAAAGAPKHKEQLGPASAAHFAGLALQQQQGGSSAAAGTIGHDRKLHGGTLFAASSAAASLQKLPLQAAACTPPRVLIAPAAAISRRALAKERPDAPGRGSLEGQLGSFEGARVAPRQRMRQAGRSRSADRTPLESAGALGAASKQDAGRTPPHMRMSVPPLWTGEPPFTLGMQTTEDEATDVDALNAPRNVPRGADWVGGQNRRAAEGTFLGAFDPASASAVARRPGLQRGPLPSYTDATSLRPSLPAMPSLAPEQGSLQLPVNISAQGRGQQPGSPGTYGGLLAQHAKRAAALAGREARSGQALEPRARFRDDQGLMTTSADLAAAAATAAAAEAAAARRAEQRAKIPARKKGRARARLAQLCRALDCRRLRRRASVDAGGTSVAHRTDAVTAAQR